MLPHDGMGLLRDLRLAARNLARRPGFTVVVLATLALGIGVDTALFGVVHQILLRPLGGVEEPETLVRVYTSDYSSGPYGTSSYPDYRDYRQQLDAFSDLAAFAEWPQVNLETADGAERLTAALVSGNFFPLLGTRPAAGRLLQPGDDVRPGGHPVVVLSHALWRSRFGADPATVGRQVVLDGSSYTVVGVAPAAFTGMDAGTAPDLWAPMAMAEPLAGIGRYLEARGARWMEMVGRPAPGVTRDRAAAQVTAVAGHLAAEHPDTNLGTLQAPDAPRPMTLVDASSARVGPEQRDTVERVAALVLAAAGLVLLIVCTNLANLLLARARRRDREMAVRLSLGATRRQLIAATLVESLLLAVAGGAAGVALALWLHEVLLWMAPDELVALLGLSGLTVSLPLLAFALAVSLAAGLLFGLAPAWRAAGADLRPGLAGGEGRPLLRGSRVTLKDVLVVVQVALAVVLLVGTGLLVRSLRATLAVDPGFRLQDGLVAEMAVPRDYDDARVVALLDRLDERLGALPGVTGVTRALVVPVSPAGMRRFTLVEGYRPAPGEGADGGVELDLNLVGPDWFAVMGIDLLAGRGLRPADDAGPPVAVVNRQLVRRYFAGAEPAAAVGRTLRWSADGDPVRIVGVVADSKYRSLREETLPYVYLPLGAAGGRRLRNARLVLATDGEPLDTAPALRAALQQTDPRIALSDLRSLEAHLGRLVAAERTLTTLVGGFAVLALVLAALGIYGVLSFVVANRTREIGLRMALGAAAAATVGLFLRRGVLLAAAGAALGLTFAAAAGRLLGGLLYGVGALDPAVFAGVAAVLLVTATAAAAVPALRATRVDPVEALRSE